MSATPIIIADTVRNLLDSGVSKKNIFNMFAASDSDTRAEVASVVASYKSKTERQKESEQLYSLVSTRLNNEIIMYMDEKANLVPFRKIDTHIVTDSSIPGLKRLAAEELQANGVMILDGKLEELVRTWQNYAPVITELPKSFSLDPNELTFNFIELEVAEGPCPTFDNFIERCGANGPALMAYIWSIFEAVEVQQYALMYGEGKDGKGSLLRLIEKWVGPRAFAGNSIKDEHWVAKCVGKRVAVWSDVNSTAFVMSDLFKQVTGGDKVTVTEKFQASYSARLDLRIFIATNNEPEFTSRKSDLRRVLYVNVKETPSIPNYEEQLEAEGPAILFKCKQKFHELYDELNKEIKCDSSLAHEKASEFEIEFSAIVERCFELGEDYMVKREHAFSEVTQTFKYTSRFGQWKKWLAREYGVTEVGVRENGKTKYYLKGIKLKHKDGK